MTKKAVILCGLFWVLSVCKAQYVAIPDSNFGNWLHNNGYSSCLTGNGTVGWQLDTTCSAVQSADTIICKNANIYSLTGLQYFHNLKWLQCDSNQLTALPTLPGSLQTLGCGTNPITSLPALPAGLIGLGCESDSLTALPVLPTSLQQLVCSVNKITSLPSNLPAGLVVLACDYNQLSSLPALPAGIIVLYCDHNPALACLPQIYQPALNGFYISGTAINCLPDSFNATSYDINPATLPICGVGNSNGCPVLAHSGGPNQSICLNNTATMSATGIGTWSPLASNPATTTITSVSSPTTTISGFSVDGPYGFVWATAGGNDTVIIYVNSTLPISLSWTNLSCYGYTNGTIDVAVAGGTAPYTYTWSPAEADTNSLAGLGTGFYSLTVTSAGGCSATASVLISEPMQLNVVTDSVQNATCPGNNNGYIVTVPTGGTPPYTYTWSPFGFGFGPDLSSLAPGIYCFTVTDDNGCYASLCDTVGSSICPPDTVWPGDVDANHIVNNLDLLPIGLGYDSTGPVRIVQGIVWQADAANNWANYFTTYLPLVNFNNADCNGDGIINANDTSAIVANYGLTHTKAPNLPGPWRSGIPGLTIQMAQDTLLNGSAFTSSIYLGDSTTTVSNIYGLAFTLNYDPLVIDSNYSMFSFISSWLGNSSNSININRNFATGQVQAAITGIDHIARSGNGQIATFVGEITTSNINGKTYSYYDNINYISNVTAIDQYGNPISLNDGIDSNYVGFFVNGIKPVSAPTVSIYPNPAATQVRVSADVAISGITITDILGEPVQTISTNNTKSTMIDISGLSDGVYIVHVSAAGGTTTAKLVVSR
jgi:hypothetical protein